mmetsp:Transcript_24139/g.31315  ORF Transcript_24139/g.31315 Transcript_24139/m.31315 type:complete len:80 (-) Transcript_24139:745-984(-)
MLTANQLEFDDTDYNLDDHVNLYCDVSTMDVKYISVQINSHLSSALRLSMRRLQWLSCFKFIELLLILGSLSLHNLFLK